MPPRKAARKEAPKKRAATEEEERRQDEFDDDASESGREDSGSERGAQEEGGKEKTNCSFSAKIEERLVEFFSVNPAFYDKTQPNYQNQQLKDKLLDQLANELKTTSTYLQFLSVAVPIYKLYKLFQLSL
jgi:hypothetical protein